jgi:hypothetical protein
MRKQPIGEGARLGRKPPPPPAPPPMVGPVSDVRQSTSGPPRTPVPAAWPGNDASAGTGRPVREGPAYEPDDDELLEHRERMRRGGVNLEDYDV